MILLCCDGIFECLSSQQVAAFVLEKCNPPMDPAQVLCELMELSLSLGSQDNMTATLILFDHDTAAQPAKGSVITDDDKGQTTKCVEEKSNLETSETEVEIRFGEMPHNAL